MEIRLLRLPTHFNINIPHTTSVRASCLRPLYVATVSAAFFGFVLGFENGIISNAMVYIQHNKAMQPMDQHWEDTILNVVPGVAAVSSLLTAPIADNFGRKKIIQSAILCDIIGGLLCSLALNKIMLVIGRVVIGIALVYISEISPPGCRGILITTFQLLVTVGLVLSNITAGGFSYLQPIVIGWRLMLGFTVIPTIIQFIVFSFMPESPRWLCADDQHEKGIRVMQWLHCNDEKLQQKEIDRLDIYSGYKARLKEMLEGGWRLTHLLQDVRILGPLIVGCLLQITQQLSAINAVFYYSSVIIKAAGVKKIQMIIWLSCIIMTVNFLATIVPLLTIEWLGRRRLLLTSMAGTAGALALIGASFVFISQDSIVTIPLDQTFDGNILDSVQHFQHCAMLGNCDSCVADQNCGFCFPKTSATFGYCLPINENVTLDGTKSLVGPCAYSNSSYDWEDNFCSSRYDLSLLLALVTFIIFFSCGYAPLVWVINAENYPIWARITCVGIATSCNWSFDLIVSLTYLWLSKSLGKDSAFFLYAGITLIALVLFFTVLPETKGTSLEDLEAVAQINQKPVILTSYAKYNNYVFQSQDSEHMERF